jgi:hypothetical protein
MAQRRHHYEVAFEGYLREHRIPYISVDEARRAILPRIAPLRVAEGPALKAFDFVVYGSSENLLLEVKGRRLGPSWGPSRGPSRGSARGRGGSRMECWATREDVDSLGAWASLFGTGFGAALVFVYGCEAQPPDALFGEVFTHRDRFYALRCVSVEDYRRHMRVRSAKWGTVDLSPGDFRAMSRPFLTLDGLAERGGGGAAGWRGAGVSEAGPQGTMEPIGA